MRNPRAFGACLVAVVTGGVALAQPLPESPQALLAQWAGGSRGTDLEPVRHALGALWGADRKAFLEHLGSDHDLLSALAADALEMEAVPASLPWALEQGLSHRSPRIRAHAASFLGRKRAREAAPRLAGLLEKDPSGVVREQCARALSRVGTDAQVEALAQAARHDKYPAVRRASTLGLGWIGTRKAGDAVWGGIRGVHEPSGTREALRLLTGQASRDCSTDDSRRAWEANAPAEGYLVGNGLEEVRYGGRSQRGEALRRVYLLDVSGSIPPAFKRKSVEALASAPEGCWFDVVVFGGHGAEAWRGLLAESTKASRRDAVRWASRYLGNGSGTPLAAGLRAAFREYDVDEMLLYSDGAGNIGVGGADIADYLRALNVHRRVRLEAHPPAGLHPGMARAIQESGGRIVQDRP